VNCEKYFIYFQYMKIGLALSGGGARGIAHIGVIKAMEELGIRPDVLSGTSAGSIVAVLYANGMKPDDIFDVVSHLSIFKSVKMAWAWSGLLKMEGLHALLTTHIPQNTFESLKIPLTVAATDIRLGETAYFSSGELAPAIVSSCSIPGVFDPVHFNDHLYVDGGLLDNLPTRPLRDQCDFLIGSHCNHLTPQYDERSLKAVIERSMLITISANTTASRMICDLVIEPPHMARFTVFEMGRAREIFDDAYKYTKDNFLAHHFQKSRVA
jgi:NTE family protein